VAPGVPTSKGGDNSVQSYGLEADSSERVAAAATVDAYLAAQAAGRWGEACSYLSSTILGRLEDLAQEKGGGAEDCAEAMALFLAKVPKAALRTAADIQVLSMRVQGPNAFVIYKDGEGTPTEIVMASEEGQWKVDALVGNLLGIGG
jgi:hypothetical protein